MCVNKVFVVALVIGIGSCFLGFVSGGATSSCSAEGEVCDLDGNTCTYDLCVDSGTLVCTYQSYYGVSELCDDGDSCTNDDHCDGSGKCVGTNVCDGKVTSTCITGYQIRKKVPHRK